MRVVEKLGLPLVRWMMKETSKLTSNGWMITKEAVK